MNCNFVTGKIGNENKKFYLCTTHKQYETEDTYNGYECRYQEKESFTKEKTWKASEIKELEFIFSIPFNPIDSEIWVNHEKVSALFIEDARIIKDDFFGLYTSLNNHKDLELAKCSYCNHYHTDNEIFAIKPHNPHLCYYCGKMFLVEKENISNELIAYFKIPALKEKIEEKENKKYKYNLLTGEVTAI